MAETKLSDSDVVAVEDYISNDVQLKKILEQTSKVCHSLDWVIAGDIIRDSVWEQKYRKDMSKPDIGLVIHSTRQVNVISLKEELVINCSGYGWDVVNCAELGFDSIEDYISLFPEVATCVGVTLDEFNRVSIVSPMSLGIRDLLDGVWRVNDNNPKATLEYFRDRTISKRIVERYPNVLIKFS